MPRGPGTVVAALVFLLIVGTVRGVQAEPLPATVPLLARTLPEIEAAMLDGFQREHLTDHLIWVAADTNGTLIVGWLVLTFPVAQGDPVPFLEGRGWDLVRTAFASAPSLDEVDLTALPSGEMPFGINRHRVVFSAAVSRSEFFQLAGSGTDHSLGQFPRVWVHPSLLSHEAHRAIEGFPRSVKPSSPAAAENAVRFQGSPSAQARELRHHIAGLAYGTIVEGKLYHGSPSRPLAALTFDDGPFPIYTTLLLDTLARMRVNGTFFLVGEQVQQFPYFAQAIVRAGHEVANHTFHHTNLTQLPLWAIEEELRLTQESIAAVTGQTPEYFRPPGGDYGDSVLRAARALGLITVLWTDNPGDYANPAPSALEARTLANLTNGGILLLHQGVGVTIRVLPEVVNALHRRGLTFTTVSGLRAVPRPAQRRR